MYKDINDKGRGGNGTIEIRIQMENFRRAHIIMDIEKSVYRLNRMLNWVAEGEKNEIKG